VCHSYAACKFSSACRLHVKLSCVGFRIPGSVLAAHPLVHTALSSLNAEFISEASVNGIFFFVISKQIIIKSAKCNSDTQEVYNRNA